MGDPASTPASSATSPAGDELGRLGVGQVLGETWAVYRREFLVAIPAAVAARLTVVVAVTLLIEIPVIIGHLLSGSVVLDVTDDRIDLYVGALVTAVWAGLGHHLLTGVLERVVAAERHGHDHPTFRATLHGLPWGRLIVADVVLAVVVVVGLALALLPGLVLLTLLAPVMPLLSMRHENLRTAWPAAVRLVRGSFWPVAAVFAIVVLTQAVVVEGTAELVHAVTHSHTLEVVVHGLASLVVVPYTALVPVIITFDLLDRRGIAPEARY